MCCSFVFCVLHSTLFPLNRVVSTACVFFKRFYLNASFCEFDPRLVAPTVLFVAAKVEVFFFFLSLLSCSLVAIAVVAVAVAVLHKKSFPGTLLGMSIFCCRNGA